MRNLVKTIAVSGAMAAFGIGLLPIDSARADYYVRPLVQIGPGEIIDGYEANGATSASQNFTSDLRASVDLSSGTVKTYLNVQGPAPFTQTGATFGDRLTFSSNALGTTANVSFAFDGQINADAWDPELNSTMQFGVLATLYVYEAGSGATYQNYGATSLDAYKAFGQSKFISFTNPATDFSQAINDAIFGSFTIGEGAYDIFTGLTVFAVTNSNPVNIEMNFLNTGTFGIQTAPGVTFSSDSGVLLTAGPVNAVPEPASWAMMIGGFGLIGGMLRRHRRTQPNVSYA